MEIKMSRELMQQALDEMARYQVKSGDFDRFDDVIKNLRQALAQPEQEPVAWLYNGHLHECDPSEWAVTDVMPLYKLPPHKPWVGLTDCEINTIANSPQPIDETSNGYVLPFAHAIQSRLKEKNT